MTAGTLTLLRTLFREERKSLLVRDNRTTKEQSFGLPASLMRAVLVQQGFTMWILL